MVPFETRIFFNEPNTIDAMNSLEIEEKMKRLPSFFVIGAQKAGTTTLHNWLIQQPDICLPVCKETQFFSSNDKYKLGIDWYIGQFPKRKRNSIIGEIDPDYLFFKETPCRISTWIKSVKIIIIFRNPIDRAYSHYLMTVRRGYEKLQFDEALLAESERLSVQDDVFAMQHYSYMTRGKYFEQVKRYLDAFPNSEFLFVKFDDFFRKERSLDTYSGLCKFIGLASPLKFINSDKKFNQASKPRLKLLANLIYGHSPLKKAIGLLIPSKKLKLKIAILVDRINQSPLGESSEDWRQLVPNQIWDLANEEILKIESLTGLNLQNWIHKR